MKIVASNAGVEICGDGPTHQACEDLAVMRAIPNLVVLSPSDPVTTRLATEAIARYQGPVYMRLGRQIANVLHPADVSFQIGRMIRLREGDDLAVIATGHMVEQAMLAAEIARQARGIKARVLDCHTIKPIDVDAIVGCGPARPRVSSRSRTITRSEGWVPRSARSWRSTALCRVLRVGLQDRFASSGRDYRLIALPLRPG